MEKITGGGAAPMVSGGCNDASGGNEKNQIDGGWKKMKKLKNYIQLGSKVAVYVPSTVDVDKAADTSGWVAMVSLSMSQWFGGATSTSAAGYWEDERAGLVTEAVTVVYSYTDSATLEQKIDDVLRLVHKMKDDLKQSAVSLEVNGVLYLV